MLRHVTGIGLLVTAAVCAAAPATVHAAEAEEYAYELVSAAGLEGNGVTEASPATADGGAVRFTSAGTIEGLPGALYYSSYVARRTAEGWAPELHAPRRAGASPSLTEDSAMPFGTFTDLSGTFFTTAGAFDPADQNGVEDVYLAKPDGTFRWLTPRAGATDNAGAPVAVYGGQSPDGGTAVVQSAKQLLGTVPGGVNQVYAWRNGALSLVSRVGGVPSTGAVLGGGTGPTTDDYDSPREKRAVSADGRRIVFTTTTGLRQVYVSDAGTTVAASATKPTDGSAEVLSSAASVFQTASADGRYVFFTTAGQLTGTAHPTASAAGLYRFDVQTNTQQLVSAGALGAVTGVVRASADGNTVAYVANEAAKQELYLWRAGQPRQHVATLAGTDLADLWGAGKESFHNGRISADGSLFVFAAKAKIGTFDNGTSPTKRQVYAWDADAATLACLSCGVNGQPTGAGTGSLVDTEETGGAADGGTQTRNLTDDGRVIFETTTPLDPADTDALADVYVWDGTRSTLLSVGADEDPVWLTDNSADGRTVFVRTAATLLAADTDRGATDLYALRLGGGFPEPEAPVDCGAAAGCRGAGSPVPAPAAPGSTLIRPGNPVFPPAADETPGDGTDAAKAPQVRKLSAADGRTWARTGRLTVKVTFAAAGTARLTARATIGGKAVTVASGTANAKKAGTASVTLRLSTAAKRALRRSGKLTVRLRAAAGTSSTGTSQTLVLRRAGARR